MKGRRIAGAVAGVALGAAVLQGCPSTPTVQEKCLAEETVVAPTNWPLLLSNTEPTTYDARFRTFNTDKGYVKAKYTVPGTCWVGGKFGSPTRDSNLTAWKTWHDDDPPGGNNASADIYASSPGTTVTGVRLYNSGDGIATNGKDWLLDSILVDGEEGDRVHDDCIQNDIMNTGKVQDSLFDGCFVFMSSRGLGKDGTGNSVEIANTLVRLRPYFNSYGCDTTSAKCNANGGFFKWGNDVDDDGSGPDTDSDGISPTDLYVHDSVFRADQHGLSGGTIFCCVNGQKVNAVNGIPPGTRCERVTIIVSPDWLDDRETESWRRQCTDLTILSGDEGDQFWDDARAAWLAEHQ